VVLLLTPEEIPVNIPDSLKNTDVAVALAIPMPAQGNTGLTFPLVEGQITETFDSSFLIKTSKGDEMLLPHSRVQHIVKVSKIERVQGGIVMPGRA
jgi:hypothetical protein